jgi:hypothetical protein
VKHWPSFVAAPLAVFAPAALATVYLSVEQAQQVIFPGGSFIAAPVSLSAEQKHALKGDLRNARLWSVSGGGWFVVDKVIGKHELITYALGLNGDGSVRGIEILEYRESYGGEIRYADWRRQFVGKTAADPLRLEDDIRNISGATLSCRHVTEGVKRLLALHEIVLKQR